MPVFRVQEGEFTGTATTPDDVLKVVIPSWDGGEHEHGDPDGVVWAPRIDAAGAAVYPATGDWCAVVETDEGAWVVLAWTPG